MPDITTVLTASVTLISAFSTLSPMHNGLFCVFMTLLSFLLDSTHDRQKHGKSLKPPSLLPSSDMVLLFVFSTVDRA